MWCSILCTSLAYLHDMVMRYRFLLFELTPSILNTYWCVHIKFHAYCWTELCRLTHQCWLESFLSVCLSCLCSLSPPTIPQALWIPLQQVPFLLGHIRQMQLGNEVGRAPALLPLATWTVTGRIRTDPLIPLGFVTSESKSQQVWWCTSITPALGRLR
jgi:hypothetical protein